MKYDLLCYLIGHSHDKNIGSWNVGGDPFCERCHATYRNGYWDPTDKDDLFLSDLIKKELEK